MIYGIGTDLCDVGRIEKSIARPAFLQHVYTPAEQELIVAHTGKKQAETAAANFAAKEAFSKALGTGLRAPATFQNIAVSHDELGKPILILAPALASFIQAKNITQMHISISDEKNLAAAFVVLEV